MDRTVWYRFFPDVEGRISMQAVGFDATLALVQLGSVAAPLPQSYTCANSRDDTIETFSSPVEARTPYAVQVGGVMGAAGLLQVTFEFTPDRDGDGVGDEEDVCPATPAGDGGCPPRVDASFAHKYDNAHNGVRFLYINVTGAPTGARIDVRCTRRCRHQRVKVRSRITRLKAFRGRFVPNGARIEVRVTKRGHVGSYRRFTVSGGDVQTADRCLPPASSRPRRTCD